MRTWISSEPRSPVSKAWMADVETPARTASCAIVQRRRRRSLRMRSPRAWQMAETPFKTAGVGPASGLLGDIALSVNRTALTGTLWAAQRAVRLPSGCPQGREPDEIPPMVEIRAGWTLGTTVAAPEHGHVSTECGIRPRSQGAAADDDQAAIAGRGRGRRRRPMRRRQLPSRSEPSTERRPPLGPRPRITSPEAKPSR
jgi:hypothetical protein